MIEIGKRYNRLVCLGKDENRDYRYYLFRCDCGNIKSIIADNVERGATTSCGCYIRGKMKRGELHHKHGGKGTRLYGIWKAMRERCNTKTAWRYADWGGRGIRICKEWDDFATFREWALANGYNDTLTIDRIDTNKDYCPENCRWATYKEQANNMRSNHHLTIDGVTRTIAEWSSVSGIRASTISARLKRGWSAEEAVYTPLIKFKGDLTNGRHSTRERLGVLQG